MQFPHIGIDELRTLWRGREQFTILKIGNAGAANFLAAWQAWLDDDPAQRCERLHVVSIESHPAEWDREHAKRSIDEAAQARREVPGDGTSPTREPVSASSPSRLLRQQLIAHWPVAVRGIHRLEFSQGKVVLTLAFDTVAESFAALWLRADVICLNGADPIAQNRSDTTRVAKSITRLAGESATVVCEALDDSLRASLEAGGFVFEDRRAPSPKPDIVRGCFAPRWRVRRHEPPLPERSVRQRVRAPLQREDISSAQTHAGACDFTSPKPPASSNEAAPLATASRYPDALIIGAGLAGSALAERLASRGLRLALIDASASPASHASGNPAGVFHPLVAPDDSLAARATRAGFLYALSRWQALEDQGFGFAWRADGLVQVATQHEEEAAYRDALRTLDFPDELVRYVSSEDAYTLLGARPAYGGLYFPRGGMLDPASLCRAQLACASANTKLALHFQCVAARLERESGLWHAIDRTGNRIASAPIVIVANAGDATRLAALRHAPTRSIRGQLTWLEPGPVTTLRHPLIGDGYVLPLDPHAHDGRQLTGASYELDDPDDQLRADSQRENFDRLCRLLPEHADRLRRQAVTQPLAGRVAFRCVTSDRLPMIGQLADEAAAHEQAARLSGAWPLDLPRAEGLYGAYAYGSRGLVWAALGAEIIASQICGEPLPVGRDIADGFDPARFLQRALRQRELT
ncbi:MAG: FAD-dependent 5-carboxymethylaminomethyl-2-thiouridine(34) oxidoreductase MnmC [Pararobbsia sp.]